MIRYSVKAGRLTFQVYVVPRSSSSEIVGEYNGALRLRIAAPPVDGAANEEVIRILAKAFDVTRSAVEINSGLTGKRKTVSISGVGPEQLGSLLKI